MTMQRIMPVIALAGALLAATPGAGADEGTAAREARPGVEVVFVLDTTGSMSGLIEGAKTKIWKIVNQVVSGKPVPDVRVGLVAYRDRGDEYVTRVTALTDDLDAIYGVVKEYAANGGGDEPESVNQALHEALTKFDWSRDERTLRIIYLVGDSPPHMDYGDDVKYVKTCEAAARAGIIINTIQCGGNSRTTPIWREIARRAEGRFVQISQSGGMAAVATPFDERLAKLDRELSGLTVFYGTRADREEAEKKLAGADEAMRRGSPEAAADRAGYRSKSGKVSSRDLLSMLEGGEIAWGDVDPKLLPDTLRKMSGEERKKRLDELLAKRKAIRAELLDLDRKRTMHIEKELAKAGTRGDAFDEKVLETLRDQAKKVGLTYD